MHLLLPPLSKNQFFIETTLETLVLGMSLSWLAVLSQPSSVCMAETVLTDSNLYRLTVQSWVYILCVLKGQNILVHGHKNVQILSKNQIVDTEKK